METFSRIDQNSFFDDASLDEGMGKMWNSVSTYILLSEWLETEINQ